MDCGESIFFDLAFRNVRFHIFLTSEVEGDRPINLLEAQHRIMRSNGLGGFPTLKFSDDVGQGNATSDQVEAIIPSFNEFLAHRCFLHPVYTIPAEWHRDRVRHKDALRPDHWSLRLVRPGTQPGRERQFRSHAFAIKGIELVRADGVLRCKISKRVQSGEPLFPETRPWRQQRAAPGPAARFDDFRCLTCPNYIAHKEPEGFQASFLRRGTMRGHDQLPA